MGVIHASLKDAHGKVGWEDRAWTELPPEACAFCRWLLTFEVGQRPTASEALQGEWLRSSTPDPTLPRRASTWGAPEGSVLACVGLTPEQTSGQILFDLSTYRHSRTVSFCVSWNVPRYSFADMRCHSQMFPSNLNFCMKCLCLPILV